MNAAFHNTADYDLFYNTAGAEFMLLGVYSTFKPPAGHRDFAVVVVDVARTHSFVKGSVNTNSQTPNVMV